jgi:uncharacterized membrane protein
MEIVVLLLIALTLAVLGVSPFLLLAISIGFAVLFLAAYAIVNRSSEKAFHRKLALWKQEADAHNEMEAKRRAN